MKHWTPGDFPAELVEVRGRYRVALQAARRVADAAAPRGRDDADYWVGRFEFGIAYLEALEAVRSAANAEHEQRPTDAARGRKRPSPLHGVLWRPMPASPATNRTAAPLRR